MPDFDLEEYERYHAASEEATPDPNRQYQALTSYSGPQGTVREGELRLGTDPAVLGQPRLWVPADWRQATKDQAKLARLNG